MSEGLERWSAQARKGYFELLLLTHLAQGRTYGYALVALLRQAPGFEDLAEGTVYPVLARLRAEGFISAEWVTEDSGTPRKYYAVTEDGRDALVRMRSVWTSMNAALNAAGGDDGA
ncbi:MAG: PadR family transcriptional regulator [Maricaulis sp.]|nr:PadR family transcriptional regulator [Maricaulis sp.]HAQ34087.1 PadR family transcriptional regulator [Alphaproteobacteria bacterium]